MSAPVELVRPDLRGFAGYASARTCAPEGDIWLNANESAWSNEVDAAGCVRRYPDPQPVELRATMARLYGCATDQLLIGRGSDELIDLLVRVLCVAGQDAILVTPPVFGMYAVSARLQDARLVEVPLTDGKDGFVVDIDAVADAAESCRAKIVFLCSPSNPTGGEVPAAAVTRLAERLAGISLVVVDEAYIEFSASTSATGLMCAHANIAVLRTLSKVHALAGARVGCVIADAGLIQVLRACQAPYPLPVPSVELALAALDSRTIAITTGHADTIRSERERMRCALSDVAGVKRVYPSQANYLLVRFDDASTAFQRLIDAGVVVRDQRAAPQLEDALRISIGTPDQNNRVLQALSGVTQ